MTAIGWRCALPSVTIRPVSAAGTRVGVGSGVGVGLGVGVMVGVGAGVAVGCGVPTGCAGVGLPAATADGDGVAPGPSALDANKPIATPARASVTSATGTIDRFMHLPIQRTGRAPGEEYSGDPVRGVPLRCMQRPAPHARIEEPGMVDDRSNDDALPTGSSDADPEAAPAPPVTAKPRRSRASTRTEPVAAAGETPATAAGSRSLELVGQGAERINADSLSLRQGGINVAEARQIDLRQGGITRAQADDIAVTQGGIAMARGERVSVEIGAVGLAVGGEVRLTQAVAGSILAREVRIEQGGARTIVASHATFERASGTVMLIAARVDGDVRTILDWRGALAFGAAFGLVAGLVRRARR